MVAVSSADGDAAMPKHSADPHHAADVERRFHDRGFAHLRARKYGTTVIVESGPTSDPVRHLRLQRDTVHLWILEFADHRGRWERTPFRASLNELVAMVAGQFPWTVADAFGNAERTSDREH
jgi:hypothetical protein